MSTNDLKRKNNTRQKRGQIQEPNRNTKKANKGKVYGEQHKLGINYKHFLIYFLIGVLPLVVKLKIYDPKMAQFSWFTGQTQYADFFLYYKQNWLIFAGVVMLVIAIFYMIKGQKSVTLKEFLIFVPLAIYGLLALLSAVFSEYPNFAFLGSMDQFESIFALLSYCLIVYYIYSCVNTEEELKRIFQVLICATLIMAFLGVLQFAGYDFFTSELGYRFIVPEEYRNSSGLQSSFGSKRVYMSLFNPNYVGVYVALVTPVILILMFFQKKRRWIVLSAIAVLGLLVCVFGSQSAAGFMGICAAIIMMLIFLRRYIFKKPLITVPVLLLLVIGILVLNAISDNLITNKIKGMFQPTATEYALTDLETMEDGIVLTYQGKRVKVSSLLHENGVMSLQAMDQENNILAMNYDATTAVYQMEDPQLSNLVLGLDLSQTGVFFIEADGIKYRFTGLTDDGTYYYVNSFNRLDKLRTAPSVGFKGYESLASGRGYIWSRTIPLLKDYVLLGSGPDTFTMVFPQNDYMNMIRYGYAGQIMSKPHNLYLQIAVQTGVLSLIAFLVFYGMYFVSSIRLYFRTQFSSYYEKAGVAIFIGTVAYMVTGLTNDSSITVAPVFWVMMGLGIRVNYKVRKLI